MVAEQLVVLGGLVFGLSLVVRRLEGSPVTVPMLTVAFGVAAGPEGLGLLSLSPDDETTIVLAEATLALLLFSDASRIDLTALREGAALPARLLGIGLPLTLLTGVGLAFVLLEGSGVAEALLLAAILAPTDAALGQAVVTDERVPVAVRQGLNVESGLNDGLVLPVFAIAMALSEGATPPGAWEIVGRVAGGLVVGVTVGLVLPLVLGGARRRFGLDLAYEQLGVLASVAVAYGLAETLGTNGFLAAFTAGMALKGVAGDDAERLTAYTEDSAQLASVLAFVLFGATVLPDALAGTSVVVVACAVLALTVMRVLPVAIALLGTGLRLPTIGFLGWFGPRGLASMLLALLVVTEHGESSEVIGVVIAVAGWTVLLSVVLHGLSAAPLAGRYARWFEAGMATHGDMVEADEVSRPLLRWQRDL